MTRRIFLAAVLTVCLGPTTGHAADLFKAEITKIVEACDTRGFETTPTSDMWFRFDSSTQLTIAFNADFNNPITMKLVRHIKNAQREDFVAIRSDFIQPAVQAPVFGAWFLSIYGKFALDEELQPLSIKGDIHASFVSPEGNQDAGNECLQRIKFRSESTDVSSE